MICYKTKTNKQTILGLFIATETMENAWNHMGFDFGKTIKIWKEYGYHEEIWHFLLTGSL